MRYLLLAIFFFQCLLSSENIKLDEATLFKQHLEIPFIIDEQFSLKYILQRIEETNVDGLMLTEILDHESSEYDR